MASTSSAVHGTVADQLVAMDLGDLDAVLIVDEVGGAVPTLALRDPGRVLLGIEGWAESDRGFRLPFLRAQRLPPGTYPGQDQAVPTLGTQVVLAAPRPDAVALGGGGPASALTADDRIAPTADQLEHLAGRLDAIPLDPILPRPRIRPVDGPGLPLQPAITAANLVTFAYLGALIWILAGAGRRRVG